MVFLAPLVELILSIDATRKIIAINSHAYILIASAINNKKNVEIPIVS